ncbi:MAG: DUF3987 domain-containing protein [Janthinobacterium lividum]
MTTPASHFFAVTFFQDHTASRKQEELHTLDSLADCIRTTTAAEKGRLPWLKLARFGDQRTKKGSLRHDANMQAVSGIEADYDGERMPMSEAVERLTKAGVHSMVYTSPFHTAGAPRWRVLCPLADEVAPDRRDAMMGRLNGLFGGVFAAESWTRSQGYYFGAVANNLAHTVEVTDGARLDTLDELDRIWAGKPNTSAPETTAFGPRKAERLDVAKMLERIVSGDAYHTAAIRLLGYWATAGVAYVDARARLVEAMDEVPEAQRDNRWRRRRGDIDRCLADIYGKDAARRDASGRQAEEAPLPAPPEMGFLRRTVISAPSLPLDAFGPWWAPWIEQAAAGANAPPDYVAVPLLAAASALIGNARWARGWQGWMEPPSLWCASVGNPSSGKSPGAAPVMREVLGMVEQHMARDYPKKLADWKEAAKVAELIERQWEKDVALAVKRGDAVPAKPPGATHLPVPVRPRARVADATVEALATILHGLPKGVLHVRDELAGWLLNLQRYSGGSDRPFWLESYVGGPYTVDRQKNPVPLFIPRLSVATFGTIQPDRLDDALTGVDDGLAGRFLWTWPDPQPFRRPTTSCDAPAAASCLQRLTELTMPIGDNGEPHPTFLSLDWDAADLLENFGQEMQAAEQAGATGLLLTSMGKARGQALRLALVIELLRWCTNYDGEAEPSRVGLPAMNAATDLMRSYFLPMAARVLGDASVPTEERNARTLAEWIMRTRPDVVNVSSIRDGARLPGLRESDPVKQACRFLADARWLLPPAESGQAGRPRGDWIVSPLLWSAQEAP